MSPQGQWSSVHTKELHERRTAGKKALPSLRQALAQSPELREELRNRLAEANRRRARKEQEVAVEAREMLRKKKPLMQENGTFSINRAQALAVVNLTLEHKGLTIVIVDQDNYDALIVEGRDGRAGEPTARFKLGLSGGYARLADGAAPLEAAPDQAGEVE